MSNKKNRESRRVTVWDEVSELTETQSFIKAKIEEHYDQRHPKLQDSGEVGLINSYVPKMCPFCGCKKIRKFGTTANNVQRYRCSCGKTFLPTTGTIFDEHRVCISEWIEYCVNLFRHVSIYADSWNNRNAFTTLRYWLQKVFLTLEGYQKRIKLSDTVWLDEAYCPVRSEDIVRHEDGTKLRGLSRNQICIGVATDKKHTVFLVEGNGKPSQKKSFETFRDIIEPGSILIHDKEFAHTRLVNKLSLQSVAYASSDLKKLPDGKNPLDPVNRQHALLKHFLQAHTGFLREHLQGYLDLFAFVTNPPAEMELKVENLLKLAFENPRLLRYRDFYHGNSTLTTNK